MELPSPRLRIPTEIRPQTIAFLNWYFNTIHHAPNAANQLVNHAENEVYEYDWHPRMGISRLTLAHMPSGVIAMNAFDFQRLPEDAVDTVAPPASLLLTTWFDLCVALEWVSDTAVAATHEWLAELAAADAHQLGEPVYGQPHADM